MWKCGENSLRWGSRSLAMLTLFLLAGALQGQVPAIPAAVSVPVGRLSTITIQSPAGPPKYSVVGTANDKFREYDPDPNKVILRIIGYEEGVIYITTWSADKNGATEGAVCVLTIGGKSPGPGPTPGPVDPLIKTYQAAYDQENDPLRTSKRQFITAVFEGAGSLLTKANTRIELLDALGAVLHDPTNGIPKGSLPLLMRQIVNTLENEIGKADDTPLDKDRVKATFTRIANALKGVK